MKKLLLLLFILLTSIIALFLISKSIVRKIDKNPDKYLNLSNKVQYTGMKACIKCHNNIYQTFIQTGMGQSFNIASKKKSAAKFGKDAMVYDAYNDLYYKPFWDKYNLMFMEFRLRGKDTIHKRIEHIKYIIGSGQHTNSHIIDINGYLYQAPITFYTQREIWDLAPGFEEGFNSRFSRMLGLECISCHNALPTFVEGSVNKYLKIPRGIDCERCHGPGGLHVKEKLAGNIIDTSKHIDYTIVNPADLSISLQMSLCQRCHLQGISVLQPGKTFKDFKPGMHLNKVWNVFMPHYKGSNDKFIMASHVERLKMSKCYINSKEISCITCHNPHKSVEIAAEQTFNSICQKCHNSKCSAPLKSRSAMKNSCIACHMPKSGSIDIPHIAITDHYIRKPSSNSNVIKRATQKFLGLKCLTDKKPSQKSIINAYLSFYEKFSAGEYALDSAERYLANYLTGVDVQEYLPEIIHFYFLKNDLINLLTYATNSDMEKIDDSWTNYRIGQAYYSLKDYKMALPYFKKAVDSMPYNLNFHNKLGNVYMQVGELNKAKKTFKYIVAENPKYIGGLSNLGFSYLKLNEFAKARYLYDLTLSLNPDHKVTLLNKVGLFIYMKEYKKAKMLTDTILQKYPDSKQAKLIQQQLIKINQ